MRRIHWNRMARLDYFNNISFLQENWSNKEAQNFIEEVNRLEVILSKGNIDFQKTNRPRIKRCVVSKQITLFYKSLDDSNIELLRFWNNNQDLKRLKF